MENRINVRLIGAGFIIAIGIIISLLFWVHKSSYDDCSEEYNIFFERSISGLRKGDPVVYNGIRSGRVLEINRDPSNIERVVVKICIEKNYPVKVDAYATIESKSITGGSVVSIYPGSNNAPTIIRHGKELPTIPTQPSKIDQVIKNLPKVISAVTETFEKFNTILTKDTQKNLQSTVKSISGILKKTDRLLHKKDKKIGEVLDLMASNLAKFEKIQSFFIKNEYGINTFLSDGMINFTRFMKTGSNSMESFKQILDSLEKSPGRFFHNDSTKGVNFK